jgi:hypothetical protein
MAFIQIDNSPLARAFTKPWYPALGNARDGATGPEVRGPA